MTSLYTSKCWHLVLTHARWEGQRLPGRSAESSPSADHWLQNMPAEEILGWPCQRLHDLRRIQRHRGPTCCLPGKPSSHWWCSDQEKYLHCFLSSSSRATLEVLCSASWTETAGRCMEWWASAPSAAPLRINPACSPAQPPTSHGLRRLASGTSSCTEPTQQSFLLFCRRHFLMSMQLRKIPFVTLCIYLFASLWGIKTI